MINQMKINKLYNMMKMKCMTYITECSKNIKLSALNKNKKN